MTQDELNVILEKHKKWLDKEDGGERANLCDADLRGLDLQSADLRCADLTNTKLRHSYLQCADLRVACITNTDFSDTEMLLIGNIGSRNDTTYYQPSTNMIRCGYYTGTLEEFEVEVEETHKDNPRYRAEYRAAIQFFKSMKIMSEPCTA